MSFSPLKPLKIGENAVLQFIQHNIENISLIKIEIIRSKKDSAANINVTRLNYYFWYATLRLIGSIGIIKMSIVELSKICMMWYVITIYALNENVVVLCTFHTSFTSNLKSLRCKKDKWRNNVVENVIWPPSSNVTAKILP